MGCKSRREVRISGGIWRNSTDVPGRLTALGNNLAPRMRGVFHNIVCMLPIRSLVAHGSPGRSCQLILARATILEPERARGM